MEEDATQSVVEAPVARPGPGAVRTMLAKVVLAGSVIIFGAAGYFGIWYLVSAGAISSQEGGMAIALTAGALLAGVIVGGILGAKLKQALLGHK